MRPDNSYGQRGPDDDPTSEFKVGQQFDNKEAVLIVIKTYRIRRAVEYKILERQDHRRLDSKLIAQDIFKLVQADPSIDINVLQGSTKNHFGYKAEKFGLQSKGLLPRDMEIGKN
ncbi:hypothetical protein PIB30_054359 [Stylosanthes scabra]|uniref:Uncharacterized protein n=1 Tax=Stylosanthes scabra TaxID=79078 RepID=A0ABU6ZHH2_9FABA|nr:hypothetical protein [Stylosanthes scabra]